MLTIYRIAAEYAPYDLMPAFWRGVSDHVAGTRTQYSGVDEQAYDRGMETSMRVEQARLRAGK